MNDSLQRLEQLRLLLEEDPEEPFLHYAICLEWKKLDSAQAFISFRKLTETFPEYLPAFYQFGLLLAETGKTDESLMILEKGIILAMQQSEHHALSELKGLRQDILAGEYE